MCGYDSVVTHSGGVPEGVILADISGTDKMKIRILIFAVLLFPLFLSALECGQCGKSIRGRYVKTQKNNYCSQRCFRRTLPKCERCGKACEKGFVTMMQKKFCSKICMEQTFRCSVCRKGMSSNVTIMTTPQGRQVMLCPACCQGPKCYFCALPHDGRILSDGRNICTACQQTAVKDPEMVRRLFRQVRYALSRWYGFDNTHPIELKVVDYQELEKVGKNIYQAAGGRRLALMQYQQEFQERVSGSGKKQRIITREVCRIYVLKSTPELMLRDALAHELTHDHLRHKIGQVKDLTSEEGFCELVASLYNARTGKPEMNKSKEANQDPVYGAGFRKMRSIYQKTGSLQKTMSRIR